VLFLIVLAVPLIPLIAVWQIWREWRKRSASVGAGTELQEPYLEVRRNGRTISAMSYQEVQTRDDNERIQQAV